MYRGLAWRINSPIRRNHRATTNLLPYIRGILSHHPPSLLLSKHIILPVLERFLSRNDLTVNVHYILESVDGIVDHLNPLQDKLQPLYLLPEPVIFPRFDINSVSIAEVDDYRHLQKHPDLPWVPGPPRVAPYLILPDLLLYFANLLPLIEE